MTDSTAQIKPTIFTHFLSAGQKSEVPGSPQPEIKAWTRWALAWGPGRNQLRAPPTPHLTRSLIEAISLEFPDWAAIKTQD